MILDKQNLFSNEQAITDTADSENIIDLGLDASDVFNPNEKNAELLVQVVEDFATLTSLTVSVQTDADAAFSDPTTLFSSAAVAAASLLAGYKFKLPNLSEGLEQYVKLVYTVAGSDATAGKITAGLVIDKQTNV